MAPASKASSTGTPEGTIGAVVVAAGNSSRMSGVDKIFEPVMGFPLITYSLDQLEAFSPVTEVVLVLDESSLDRGWELVRQGKYCKVSNISPGGDRRQDSVRSGLKSLTPCQWVIVHDGARPCLDHQMLQRGLEAAEETGAAVAGVPVKDTIKVVSENGLIVDTPDRAGLWAAQTPQIFRYSLLLAAHQNIGQQVTDDAAMVESLGHSVKMFMGSYENLKVTTTEDLALAEAILRSRAEVL